MSKKILSRMVVMLLAGVAISAVLQAQTGDVNGDGRVTTADVEALRLIVRQDPTNPPYYSTDADVDQDRMVDEYDLFRLEKFLASGSDHWDWDIRLPVREFEFNSLNNPIHWDTENPATTSEQYYPALLTEVTPGKPRVEYNIEYKRHGLQRRNSASFPPLNFKFQKSQRLSGQSSYNTKTPHLFDLRYPTSPSYRKLRLASSDEVTHAQDWFKGNDVQLRDYLSYVIMRSQGVPTSDAAVFAKFKSIKGGEFDTTDVINHERFVLYQRVDEEDDSQPFLQQYGFSEIVDSDSACGGDNDSVSYVSFQKPCGAVSQTFPIDSAIAIRRLILTEYIDDWDFGGFGGFHNEKFARKLGSDQYVLVPHDFDAAMTGGSQMHGWIGTMASNYPPDVQAIIQPGLQREALNVFDNLDNYYLFLLAADRFPFDVDKRYAKHFVKASFLLFGMYYASRDFAEVNHLPYQRFKNEPFLIRETKRLINSPEFVTYYPDDVRQLLRDLLARLEQSNPSTYPTITLQPLPLERNAGEIAEFNITAEHAEPLTYQWRRNGVAIADDVRITGSRSGHLKIISLKKTEEGTYDCVVSNSQKGLVSNSAVLKVNSSPTITAATDLILEKNSPAVQADVVIGDIDTALDQLTFSIQSDNSDLLPADSLIVTQIGTVRSITIHPALNQSGEANVTATVSDGTLNVSSTFHVKVWSHLPPVIEPIEEKSMPITVDHLDIDFTVTDDVTPASAIEVQALAIREPIINAQVTVLPGLTPNRRLSLDFKHGMDGMGSVELEAFDGERRSPSRSVLVTRLRNEAPVVTTSSEYQVSYAKTEFYLPFTVTDDNSPLERLRFYIDSTSDESLLPIDENPLTIDSHGPRALLRLARQPVYQEMLTVNLRAVDEQGAATTVSLRIVFVDTPPVISALPDLHLLPNGPNRTITFSAVDDETPFDELEALVFSDDGSIVQVMQEVPERVKPIEGIPYWTFDLKPLRTLGETTINIFVYDHASTDPHISFHVLVENQTPVALSQSVRTLQDTALPIVLSATDADAQTLSYKIETSPTKGTLSGTAPNFIYTPLPGATGTDSFTFKATDGLSDSNTGTVTIQINKRYQAPIVTLIGNDLAPLHEPIRYKAELTFPVPEDANDFPLQFIWIDLNPVNNTVISGETSANPEITFNETGRHKLRVDVHWGEFAITREMDVDVESPGETTVSVPKSIDQLIDPGHPEALFVFEVPSDDLTDVKIYDRYGHFIHSLQVRSASPASVSWNGTNRDGEQVASGIYIVHAIQNGNLLKKGKVVVVR